MPNSAAIHITYPYDINNYCFEQLSTGLDKNKKNNDLISPSLSDCIPFLYMS